MKRITHKTAIRQKRSGEFMDRRTKAARNRWAAQDVEVEADAYYLRRQCEGKMTYVDRKFAKRAVRSYQLQHGERLDVYRCQRCRLYHMGHGDRKREWKSQLIAPDRAAVFELIDKWATVENECRNNTDNAV